MEERLRDRNEDKGRRDRARPWDFPYLDLRLDPGEQWRQGRPFEEKPHETRLTPAE